MKIIKSKFDALIKAERIMADMARWPDPATRFDAQIALEAIHCLINSIDSIDGKPRIVNHDLNSLDWPDMVEVTGATVIDS